MTTTHFVLPTDGRAARNAWQVARIEFGDSVKRLDLEAVRLDRDAKRAYDVFKHTPQPLLDAWAAHRKLMASTNPGDTVVLSDWRGLGGLFALAQWSLPAGERRAVITVAADSACLHWLEIAATVDGMPMALASQIDWEIAQYRWSTEVVSPSERALALLSDVVEGRLVADKPAHSRPVDGHSQVWVPEPVGRRSRTGDVLRAIAGLAQSRVTVSEADEEDEVWSGSSWEALRHSRSVLGERLTRASRPGQPDVLVLGDPFSVPDETVARRVAEGLPVVVPEGSAAAVRWRSAPTWDHSDHLVAALKGEPRQSPPAALPTPVLRLASPDRARRVSVGIPVFRDVRFLDECVGSVLSQDLDPMEIVIVDDGSASDEVDAALESVRSIDDRVRILKGDHRGVCVTRNRALDEMAGDSFLFVDSDDVLEPTFLTRCAEMLRSDGRLLAVATWTRFFGAYDGIEAKPPFDARVGSRENPIISTAALVDMRVREEGVRFAPDLAFLYCEDWHFWSQIIAAGGRFGLVPEPLIRHRVHQGSGGFMRTDLAYAIGRARAVEPLKL